ncbi:hypothetical protein FHS26_001105 [Rhizobium pisi]|uniref:DUF2806 domain-containing protein n=1 Tax=Rhizobium pisi TaxID=574561 RepID=A0A7W5FYS0_9HYPH|nr:DUF2806 domain-containing protein [Rhizobium pisi]MBB3133401.1 hypothetical protein [Rhizobium pisi]
MSALDRAGARKIDQTGLEDERRAAVHQALTDTQLKLIAASTKVLEERLQADPDLAQRALTAFSRAERQAENVEASLVLAIEDLKNKPSAGAEPADSPDTLDPEFLNRWELYASGATSEVVREKWGRILSSEIREPGTFSLKTLRVIDELDHETAILFQRFCQSRIGQWAPELLLDLDASELSALEQAGLILDAEFGRAVTFSQTIDGHGAKWWALGSDTMGVAVRQDPMPSTITTGPFNLDPLRIMDEKLKMNVSVLSRVGGALAVIIPHNEEEVFRRLAKVISGDVAGAAVMVRRTAEGIMSDDGSENAPPMPADGIVTPG